MTYEDFRNPDEWETTGDDEFGVWHYQREIRKCRISVYFSGNDGYWKWSAGPTFKPRNTRDRILTHYVYDRGMSNAEGSFKEAYEMLEKDGVLDGAFENYTPAPERKVPRWGTIGF